MSRIPTPATIDDAPAASQDRLRGVEKALGMTPNLHRIIANSPAALDGYLGLNSALTKGALDAATRERIALAVSEVNACAYCLAAHTALATGLAKLTASEIAENRRGRSTDAKADAAVRFAAAVTRERGHVDAEAVEAVKAAGHSDAEVVEIIAHVALNTLTNLVNETLKTEIDFPPAATLAP